MDSRRAFLLTAAAILFYQLILPPVVGLADNGDFAKMTGRYNLYAPIHKVYEWVDTTYEIRADKHWVSEFYSLEIVLILPALWLNALLSKTAGTFDLRYIGVVHGLLFLLALWLFAPLLSHRARWLRWTIYVLVILIYCDVVYVSALNSFYMDVPAYLFLLLSVVFYLRTLRWKRKADAAMLIVCSFLLVISKTQHALIGFWLAILFAAGAKRLGVISRRWWYAAAAGLPVVALLMIWKAQPRDYTSFAVYNVTFEKILPHAWNVSRTLKDLGLDETYRPYIGMKAYWPQSHMDEPAVRGEFIRRLPLGKLLFFYARHPSMTYWVITTALDDAGQQQSFGNFAYSTGYPRLSSSRAFAVWSDVKSYFFYKHGRLFYWTFLSLSAIFGVLLYLNRGRLPGSVWLAGLCLVGAAGMEMAVATLCDSMDMTRHCTIFLVLFDMILLASAYLVLDAVEARRLSGARLFREHRERFEPQMDADTRR